MKNLLLLHGALGSEKQFDALKALLANKYNIHSFNFSGHGGRTTEANYSNQLFSENILQYLNENKIEKCDIFGYSMGGYVALHFAKINPNKVGKIMTLATKFNWTPETAAKEIKMLNPKIIEEKVPKFAALLKSRHAPLSWEIILQKTAGMMQELGNGNALNDNDFKEIKNEILISIGDQDKMISINESKNISGLLPNGKLLILNGVQHPIEKVDTNLLSSTIEKFIQ